MNWKERIIADPAILCGKPAIRGTRLSVGFLLGLLTEGWTTQQVLESYPQLQPADLQALFAYTSECVQDEELLSTHAPMLS
jgi:uncharacterized protein (DUF433 family)